MDNLKAVGDYWRKVKSGELPAPSPNEISITVCAVDNAISRIAELENDLGLKHIRAVEEALIFATDRNSGLEAKLATPVRLPPLMDGELFGKNSATANAHNNAITACSIAIRGAGFKSEATALKCVGDEQ